MSGATETQGEISESGTSVTRWGAMSAHALFISKSHPVPWPLWGGLCHGANMPHRNVPWT